VFTKDGIRTLVDVVIVDSIRTYFLPQSYTTQGFAASNAVQSKERSYATDTPMINSSL
jgi:hypothetical protein